MIAALNTFAGTWMLYFGAAVIQNTLFLGIVLLLLKRLDAISAKIRYSIAILGLVKLLLPPFLPARLVSGAGTAPASLQGIAATLASGAPGTGSVHAQPEATFASIPAIVFLVWIAVAVCYLSLCAFSTLRFAHMLRAAGPVVTDVPATPGCENISVRMSGLINMPLTLGLFPRTVFVPSSWNGWNDECKRMVLLHEASHLRRHDSLVQAIQIVVQSLYFFHPLVLLLNRRIAQYREMACDDASIDAIPSSRVAYARYLVEIAESVMRSPVQCDSASALIKRRNELLHRVHYQLGGKTMHTRIQRTWPAVMALLVALMLPLSWYHSSASPKSADQTLPRTTRSVEYIDLGIGADETIHLNGESVGHEAYMHELKKIYDSKGDHAVIKLICADDVSMAELNAIQRELIEAGLYRVEYRSSSGKKMPLALPSQEIAGRMKEIPAEHIIQVRIGSAGSLSWNGGEIASRAVTGMMKDALRNDPHAIVSIRSDGEASFKDFLTVLLSLKEGGASRIFIDNRSD